MSANTTMISAVPVVERRFRLPGIVVGAYRLGMRFVYRPIAYCVSSIFGFISLVCLLAIISVIPIVQFVGYGLMLDAMGRVSRTGRFRDGLFAIPKARRIGFTLLGVWLFAGLPIYLLADLLADSRVIDPTSNSTRTIERLLPTFAVLLSLNAFIALLRGGRLGSFLAVWKNFRFLIRTLRTRRLDLSNLPRFSVTEVWSRIWSWFELGVVGFLVSFAWLVLPTTILAVGRGRPLIGLLGAFSLAGVVLYVPFAQAHFAEVGHWRAAFDLSAFRRRFRRAPLAHLVSYVAFVVLTVPLYLFKIEVLPADVLWLPTLLFVLFLFPLKLLWGWAHFRGTCRAKPAWLVVNLPTRLAILLLAFIYVGFVFLVQYTAWRGAFGLYEHHAFLLPVPF